MHIALADLADPRVISLIALHQRSMQESSPPGTSFALDLSGLTSADVTVWAALSDGNIAGIGAMKRLGPDHAEIKSMRTAPDYLRRGVAALLLDTIVEHARAVGVARLSLETGTGPVFEPALALYRGRGFINGPAFADYRITDFNQCLHRDL